jgi:hypothetical protein
MQKLQPESGYEDTHNPRDEVKGSGSPNKRVGREGRTDNISEEVES